MTELNETEVQEAASRYATHPVLGPATVTLSTLMDWTNANSDGWPYWRKPAHAAARLMTLIGDRRDYLDNPDRPDATAEAYKRALTPIRSFRTRYEREYGGPSPAFVIHEPLTPGESGEVWAARQQLAEAFNLHDEAARRERAARELMRRAEQELAGAEQRRDARKTLRHLTDLRDLAENAGDRADLDRRVLLATPGTPLWLLPSYGEDGYHGFGQPGTSLGMTTGQLVVISTAGHDTPYTWHRRHAVAVLTAAEARDRWWITDGGGNLVSGGHRDREHMIEVRDAQHPGCLVQQGHEFIPASEGVSR